MYIHNSAYIGIIFATHIMSFSLISGYAGYKTDHIPLVFLLYGSNFLDYIFMFSAYPDLLGSLTFFLNLRQWYLYISFSYSLAGLEILLKLKLNAY